MYVFTSLALDAFASTVQSLVGYFIGRGSITWARRVVRSGALWSLGTGAALGLAMWLGKDAVIDLLVPAASVAVFLPAWGVSALAQPLGGLAFLTDGAHWGIGDYKFLRNAMIAATVAGMAGIWLVESRHWGSFLWIWIVTGIWVTVRAALGILRVWPGIGGGPFQGESEPGN
jgi:MATE family multidrug resistance protein